MEPVFEMKGEHFKPITALKAFGALLASASEDLSIIIWKLESWQNLKKIVTDVVLRKLEVDFEASLLIGFNHKNELWAYDYGNGVQKHSFYFKGEAVQIASLGVFNFPKNDAEREDMKASRKSLIENWMIDRIPEIEGDCVHLIAVIEKDL